MEIRENDNCFIITPLSPKLDLRETQRLINEAQCAMKRISFDLEYVHDCTIEFIAGIKKFSQTAEIGVFNIPSDLFALFNMMNLDKALKFFVSETDFVEDSRTLVNRRFSVL